MKRYLFALPLIFSAFIFPSVVSAADDQTIPTPPKRPEVLEVPPSYVEDLRQKNKRNTSPKVIKMEDEDYSSQYNVKMSEENDEFPELVDLTKEDILDLLDNKEMTRQVVDGEGGGPKSYERENLVPIPSQKPNLNGHSLAPSDYSEEETTLISFSLKDDQIHLDEHLKKFLRSHAVRLFNDDSDLRMDIQAYAKGIDGQQHSDVRLSLARALEVRGYLINQNISPTRLKLSPLGRDRNSNNHNRIDLVFIK